VTIGCGVCGAEVEIAVRDRTSGATCWACGASIERHAADDVVHTYAADPEARYRVRRTTGAPDSGCAYVGHFETFDDAQDACDVNYPLHPTGERQEITDRETSEQWWRSDGDQEWRLSRRGRSAVS
jgi:hypothetical protein